MRLLLLLCAVACVYSTPRAVVTFASAGLNSADNIPENVTVIKQYGRRLVVHLGRDMEDGDGDWLVEQLGGSDVVQLVEADAVVGFAEEQTTEESEIGTTDADHIVTIDRVQAADNAPNASAAMPWNLDENEPYGLHIKLLRERTAGNATVAVLDSGLAQAGIDRWRPVGGFDFISSTDYSNDQTGRDANYTDPGDNGPTCLKPSWHGTRVVSIVKQIAPNSTLLILRILGRCGSGFANDVTDAIVWAAGGIINGVAKNTHPAHIISMSLAGAGACPSYLQSGINQALSLGAVVLAAAGNQGLDAAGYFPGNCAGVLSIGASTRQGTLAAYSNYGPTLALSAPGGDTANPILTLSILNGALAPYYSTGTSFSAPHVSGLFSLLYGANIINERIQNYIKVITASNADEHCSSTFPDMYNANCRINSIMQYADMVVQQAVCPAGTFENYGLCVLGCSAGNEFSSSYTTEYIYGGKSFIGACNPGLWVCKMRTQFHNNQATITQIHIGCCNWNSDVVHGFYFNADASGSPGYGPVTSLPACGSECRMDSAATPIQKVGFCYDGFTMQNSLGTNLMFDQNNAALTWNYCGGTSVVTGFKGGYQNEITSLIPLCNILCTSCTPGKFAISMICLPCPAGQYADASGMASCRTCGAGSYSDAGAVGCTPCPFGSTSGNGAGGCSGCIAGTFTSDHVSCRSCDPGFYSGNSAESCTQCTTGHYCQASGTSTPAECDVGYYSDVRQLITCKQCELGTAINTKGAVSCPSCGPGTYASAKGQTGCTQCIEGTYGNNVYGATGCPNSCAAGTFGAVRGAVSSAVACPSQCPLGTYGTPTGRTSQATACDGTCPLGTWGSAAGKSNPTDACANKCPLGMYGIAAGQSSQAAACTNCPAGTWGAATGLTGLAGCTKCLPGTYNPLGGTSTLASCISCSPGTYNTASGSIEAAACTKCGLGMFGTASGATSAATTCTRCATGSYNNLNLGATVCTLCSPGSYAPFTGTGADGNPCVPCTLGSTYTSVYGASSMQVCDTFTSCTTAGYTWHRCELISNTLCTACDPVANCVYSGSVCKSGTTPLCICTVGYEMVNNLCVPCQPGFYRPPGPAIGPVNTCTRWTVQQCQAGQFPVDGTSTEDTKCLSCPALPPNTELTGVGCTWTCVVGYEAP